MTRTLIAIGIALLAPASLAHAQIPCMPSDAAVTEIMGPHYSEFPLFEGTLAAQGSGPVSVTVYANASTGTWTVMASPDNRTSCLILSGKDFKPATLSKVKGELSSFD